MNTHQENVQHDMLNSIYDFKQVVWPEISASCGGGDIETVERYGKPNNYLDTLAGIDAWQTNTENGRMRGIASRVQWLPNDFATFTIRECRESGMPTELAKRQYALEHAEEGWLFPAITVQAYCSVPKTGHLLRVAWVYTRDLFNYMQKYPEEVKYRVTTNDTTEQTFAYVKWDKMIAKGVCVHIVKKQVAIHHSANIWDGMGILHDTLP